MTEMDDYVFTTEYEWDHQIGVFHFRQKHMRRTACGLARNLEYNTATLPTHVPPQRRCPKNGCKQMFTTAQIEASY